eukprot:m.149966 g.149966  ORF g.149966 m.149966 type:complete len:324 (+) comp23275_c0_seq7:425-1396(+)
MMGTIITTTATTSGLWITALMCSVGVGVVATTPANTWNSTSTIATTTLNATESSTQPPPTSLSSISCAFIECDGCLAAGCAFSYIDEITIACEQSCRSPTCYDARAPNTTDQYQPVSAMCPAPTTSTASTRAVAVTVAPDNETTYKTPHVITLHEHTGAVLTHGSTAVVLGSIFGVLALTISILLFGYLRLRDTGGFEQFKQRLTQNYAKSSAPASEAGDDDDLLTQRLLFDGRDSSDVPLMEPNDYGCELDLSQPALDRNYPGMMEGSNRLWAPFTVPTSPTQKTEESTAWHTAVHPERPQSAVRPPSVTGITLAPVDDVPF